jgi:ribose transport system permease protein
VQNAKFFQRLVKFQKENSYSLALFLFILGLIVNLILQPTLIQPRVINGNLRAWLPIILLSVGQAVVMIGGGLDLSVGTLVSLGNAILVTQITEETTTINNLIFIFVVILVGAAGGLLNGFTTAALGLQPMITTYATSFIFAGLALLVLPQPGGSIPRAYSKFYRSTTPLGIPLAIFVIALVLIVWAVLRKRRYGRFLYAVGGKADAAYYTGVPVTRIRISTYMISGLMAALAAVALTLLTGSGDPRIGEAMTLESITAVIIGGTSLAGGTGGIFGAILGVGLLGTISNIISFARLDSWWRTLVNAVIIVIALAGPGLGDLLRSKLGGSDE